MALTRSQLVESGKPLAPTGAAAAAGVTAARAIASALDAAIEPHTDHLPIGAVVALCLK